MNHWRQSKFKAIKTWSELCQRKFDSKAEAKRGEELWLLQEAGAISGLEFQKNYRLCDSPKISIKLDFVYIETSTGDTVHEDVKGAIESKSLRNPGTREFRVKLAWLQEKFGITVFLTGK